MEVGDECFLGNSFDKHGKSDESECLPCDDNSGFTCGGPWYLSVYQMIPENNVVITWNEPESDGGDPIDHYRVKFYDSAGTTLYEIPECDGSDPEIIASRTCIIPQYVFTSAPLNLQLGDQIRVAIQVANNYGISVLSEDSSSGYTFSSAPSAPSTTVRSGDGIDESSIVIEWDSLTGDETGDEEITQYQVYWDAGQLGINWFLIAQETLGEGVEVFSYSHTITSGISVGTSYQFKYRAFNKYGYSPFSAISTIVTANRPDRPSAVSSEIQGDNIVVTWEEPDDRGSAIEQYYVVYYAVDGRSYVHDNCNSESESLVTSRTCSFPLNDIVEISGVSTGDVIQFQVWARNGQGWSMASPKNTEGAAATIASTALAPA
jgi:hypothetical protein